jgi:hypothetical protein
VRSRKDFLRLRAACGDSGIPYMGHKGRYPLGLHRDLVEDGADSEGAPSRNSATAAWSVDGGGARISPAAHGLAELGLGAPGFDDGMGRNSGVGLIPFDQPRAGGRNAAGVGERGG